jgi:predicted Rossmann-fold nucleotide-binding protein
VDGYYDALLAQLERALDDHFMRPIHANIWKVATTPEEAIALLLGTPEWDKNIRRFAAI